MHPRRYPSIATAVAALIAQGCGMSNSHTPSDNSNLAGMAGTDGTSGGTSSGGSGSGGSLILGSGGIDLTEPCSPAKLPFADQVVTEIGEQRVFYSWTTDEQVAELRAGTELFSRSERPGEGRGLLFTSLAAFAEVGGSPEATLAGTLVNETFAKARFAWPNPWATVLGFPGEAYGNQLLKIELSSEAWIAYFEGGALSVVDVNNEVVPIETALATPERIGAIFHLSEAEAGKAYCGSFSVGGVGFREFALGNIAMVARWSLATEEIGGRLEDDIAELDAFHDKLACLGDTSGWYSDVTCLWRQRSSFGGSSFATAYDLSLALPSELYRPSSTNIEALIATLEASLPTGEPLVVTPGQ
jgi:hypothetical protein